MRLALAVVPLVSDGAWVDLAPDTYGPELTASPSATTLPIPDDPAERDAYMAAARKRERRGIGFVRTDDTTHARTPSSP